MTIPGSVSALRLERSDLGAMTVRDQLPLKFLDQCLHPGVTAQQFLDALNSRVFFWLSTARRERLLNARANKNRPHLVMHIDTAAMLKVHGGRAQLAPYNTGSAHVPTVPKRGPDVFVDLAQYRFDYRRDKRGKSGELFVEMTIPHAVPDIVTFVRTAELRHRDDPPTVVFGA